MDFYCNMKINESLYSNIILMDKFGAIKTSICWRNGDMKTSYKPVQSQREIGRLWNFFMLPISPFLYHNHIYSIKLTGAGYYFIFKQTF